MTDKSGVEAASYPPPLPLELLSRDDTRPQLGALLLRDGALTVEQLEWALLEKEMSGKRLGEILVERGLAPGATVARALAEQHGLGFLDLARAEIDPSTVGLLPEKLARRLGALAVCLTSADTVRVAVSDRRTSSPPTTYVSRSA